MIINFFHHCNFRLYRNIFLIKQLCHSGFSLHRHTHTHTFKGHNEFLHTQQILQALKEKKQAATAVKITRVPIYVTTFSLKCAQTMDGSQTHSILKVA